MSTAALLSIAIIASNLFSLNTLHPILIGYIVTLALFTWQLYTCLLLLALWVCSLCIISKASWCCIFTFSVPPVIVMHGPTDVKFGSNVTIRCAVLEGYPSPSVSIITPLGDIINQSVISFNASMNDAGNYTCTANNSVATVTSNLSLTVHSRVGQYYDNIVKPWY